MVPWTLAIVYLSEEGCSRKPHRAWRLLLLLLPLAVVVDLTIVVVLLLSAPFSLLQHCFGRNVRASENGVEVYTIAFGVESRHAWAEIEAFWSFTGRSSAVWDKLWCLVLKDRRTIFLPSASRMRISTICDAHDRSTNGGRGLVRQRSERFKHFVPTHYCFETCTYHLQGLDAADSAAARSAH